MAGRMRMPRTRGVFSGLLLVLLGAWGGLIAFVGPYFNYAYTPDSTWTYTSDRLWMEILPGAGALLGGLIVLGSAHRAFASLGGWLAAICGAWFVIGPVLSPMPRVPNVGTPTGGTTRQALESVGFFYGVGVAIVFFAALALGRFAVVGIRETRAAEREEVEAERLATMDNSALTATGLTGGFADTPRESTVDSTGAEATTAMPNSAAGDSRWYPKSGAPVSNGLAPGAPKRGAPEPAFGRHAEPATAAAPARSATATDAADPGRTTELPPAPPLSEWGEDSESGLMNRIRPHHAGASSDRGDKG